MYVDRNTSRRHARVDLAPQTFYGQLQTIYVVPFDQPRPRLRLNEPRTFVLAALRSCVLLEAEAVPELDIHYYKDHGRLHVVDITSVQSLIGRVPDRGGWGIIDRSGSLARTSYVDNLSDPFTLEEA
jgi:hypothetical protein